MKPVTPIILAAIGIALLQTAAQPRDRASSFEAEGVKAIAAGSINPPNPVAGCDQAKAKAADAGFKGRVDWQKLSKDSDCSLQTPGARGVGYFYIFTAKGTFYR